MFSQEFGFHYRLWLYFRLCFVRLVLKAGTLTSFFLLGASVFSRLSPLTPLLSRMSQVNFLLQRTGESLVKASRSHDVTTIEPPCCSLKAVLSSSDGDNTRKSSLVTVSKTFFMGVLIAVTYTWSFKYRQIYRQYIESAVYYDTGIIAHTIYYILQYNNQYIFI